MTQKFCSYSSSSIACSSDSMHLQQQKVSSVLRLLLLSFFSCERSNSIFRTFDGPFQRVKCTHMPKLSIANLKLDFCYNSRTKRLLIFYPRNFFFPCHFNFIFKQKINYIPVIKLYLQWLKMTKKDCLKSHYFKSPYFVPKFIQLKK